MRRQQLVLVVAAYQLYKRRQIEDGGRLGQHRDHQAGIPLGSSTLRRSGRRCHGHIHAHGSAAAAQISVAAALQCGDGLPLFFGAEMLLEKNFKVFRRKRVLEWAATAVITVVFVSPV